MSRYPDDWRELVIDAGGTETAEEQTVVGALGAALREARTPDQLALELLDADGDAEEELALAIDSDPAMPRRLGALLLSDTLGPLFRLNLSLAAAA